MSPARRLLFEELVNDNRLTIEELLEGTLMLLDRTSLKDAAEDIREALVKVRLWVIGQGIL